MWHVDIREMYKKAWREGPLARSKCRRCVDILCSSDRSVQHGNDHSVVCTPRSGPTCGSRVPLFPRPAAHLGHSMSVCSPKGHSACEPPSRPRPRPLCECVSRAKYCYSLQLHCQWHTHHCAPDSTLILQHTNHAAHHSCNAPVLQHTNPATDLSCSTPILQHNNPATH